jgi:hypothetical protein
MQNGSPLLFATLAAALLASGAMEARAQDEIPLEFGTYSQSKDWCKVNRADKNGPDYKEKRVYINLTATEINWNETVGKITNVSVDGGRKINLAVELTTRGATETKTLLLIRKNKKVFSLSGVNLFYCSNYQPNPWLGR